MWLFRRLVRAAGCAGCGRSWDLTTAVDQELFWALYEELQPLAVHMQLPEGPSGRVLRELANRLFCQQEKQGRRATGQGSVKDTLWQDPAWIQSFGTLCGPRAPGNNVRTDGCQFGLSVENGQLWIGNFSLSSCSLRCKRPDALGTALHEHARPPIGPSQQDGSILNFAYAWNLRKSLRLDPPSAGPRCLAGTRPELCLSRCLADTRTTSSHQEKIFAGQEGFEPDVQSGDALPPEKKEQLEKEVAKLSGEMHELWRVRADCREWDEVKADLGVYRLSGQEVVSDPRRTEQYRQQVVAGLGFGADAGEKRPAMNPDDLAARREVLARKAGGFWVEGSPRTTVRNVMHDCVPIGPPVSQQPHNLKGEAAAWVDEKLEEEVQRGQLIRGSSAWGSPPFPTKEAPAHKRHRKRRLVVDYRRVNARVKRSTYYCRKATDVLASCAGSVWYSFLDAVTGFNQIANTKRAMEVLAIVARSGKFLPVCLTFGPVNGPDDFCFVVDRAFGPGRGRKLRYTREWVAYVDDLTIRTGRVVDGQFKTDDEAEKEIKEACKRAPVEVVQPAAAALEALGIDSKGVGVEKEKSKWDEGEADHNHPTRRVPTSRTRRNSGVWVLWFVGSFHLGIPVGTSVGPGRSRTSRKGFHGSNQGSGLKCFSAAVWAAQDLWAGGRVAAFWSTEYCGPSRSPGSCGLVGRRWSCCTSFYWLEGRGVLRSASSRGLTSRGNGLAKEQGPAKAAEEGQEVLQ